MYVQTVFPFFRFALYQYLFAEQQSVTEEKGVFGAGSHGRFRSNQVVLPFVEAFQPFLKAHFWSDFQSQVLGLCKDIQQFVVKAGQTVLVGMIADGVVFRYRTEDT